LLLLAVFTFVLFAQVRTNRTTTTEKPVVNDNVQTENTVSKLEFYPTMGYQGLLKDNEGKLVADGNYKVSFKIYESSESKESIWKETQDVEITKGIINCYIGAVEKLNLPFDKQYWLSVSVGDDELPRMIMSGTPYSLHARRIAEDAIVGGKNISVSKGEDGKLVLSGDISGGGKDVYGQIWKLSDSRFWRGGVWKYTNGLVMDGCLPYKQFDDSVHWGYNSVAFGNGTAAYGAGAFSMGYQTEAGGNYSIAIGYKPKATGLAAVAMGNETTASGASALAVGYGTVASGGGSVATGLWTTASGSYSFVGGGSSTASGVNSFVYGYNCTSGGEYGTTFGRDIKNIKSNSFMVGWYDPSLFVNRYFVTVGCDSTQIESIYSAYPSQKALYVNGKIIGQQLELKTDVWADYVFKDDYELKPLSVVEKHIIENGHLPGIIPEVEALNKGVNVGDMQVKLLEKIEELTLYIIEQDKRIKELENVK